jgi:hypothetical protein
MIQRHFSIIPLADLLLMPLGHAGIGSAITADVTVDTRTPNQPPTSSPTAIFVRTGSHADLLD